jgi:2-methylaconitate cis-trans-isomerase PrpF
MTAAVGPFAVEEGMVDIVAPITTVCMINRNTDKYINVTVPIENGTFAQDGNCIIAGVDGTAAELKVKFMNPAGSKTGKLMPTGNPIDILYIDGFLAIKATILDVSNPMVIVRALDVGLKGTESPEEINSDKYASDLLEKIRGTAAVMMGFAKDLEDAKANSPAVPKIGVFTAPKTFTDISGEIVKAEDMDVCTRVISVFKCHKACPLTSASSIAVAAFLEGSIVQKDIGSPKEGQENVRIGHPSGIMTMYPEIVKSGDVTELPSVAVQSTARRIMDGTVYVRK